MRLHFLTICFPIRLVFHQRLNSHKAYPGSPLEPSNHSRGQFLRLPSYPLLRLLWSNLTTRSLERGFSTSITLVLHLAQPHCASISKYGHHISHHVSNLPILWYYQLPLTVYQFCGKLLMWCHVWCPCLEMLAQCGWAKWSASVILVENPLSGDLVVRLWSE